MAAPSTYGVTARSILDDVGYTGALAAAVPSSFRIEAWIDRFAGRLAVAVDNAGSATPTDTQDAEYLARQQVLAARVQAQWLYASERRWTQYAEDLKAEFDDFLQELAPESSASSSDTTRNATGGDVDSDSTLEIVITDNRWS